MPAGTPITLATVSRHVVWDWNGTLLDDLDIILEALNVGVAGFGVSNIDEHVYRTHFTRPIRRFYDSLIGRPVTDMEWEHLNNTFHVEYFARVHRARLAPDALDAMDLVDRCGWGQSLLSMTSHDRLIEIVASHGLSDRFARVDGLKAPTGGLKASYLETHLTHIGVDPVAVLVVGDTPDDAAAARHVGAKVVLYDGGSHHPEELHAVGAPVAATLVEAVKAA